MTNKHWLLKGLSVSLVLVMVGIVSWFYWQPERLIRPSQTPTVTQVVRQRLAKKTRRCCYFTNRGVGIVAKLRHKCCAVSSRTILVGRYKSSILIPKRLKIDGT